MRCMWTDMQFGSWCRYTRTTWRHRVFHSNVEHRWLPKDTSVCMKWQLKKSINNYVVNVKKYIYSFYDVITGNLKRKQVLIALPLKEKVLICSITILNIVVCRTLTPATPARVIVFGVDFLHLYQFLSISVSGDIFYFCWLSLLTWMSRQCLIALLFLQPWSKLPYQIFQKLLPKYLP